MSGETRSAAACGVARFLPAAGGLVLLAVAVAAGPALAQHHGSSTGHAESAVPNSTSGIEVRPVKALSDEAIADLRAGRGMGLALAAELNSYPGPLHVLILADELGLSPELRDRVAALRDAMTARTVPLGEQIIAEEGRLDDLFAERRVTPRTLAVATARIAAVQAELRTAHLEVHLTLRELLTPDQIAAYDRLRGYAR